MRLTRSMSLGDLESAVMEQNRAAAEGKTPDLQKLVAKGQTWQVEKEPHAV